MVARVLLIIAKMLLGGLLGGYLGATSWFLERAIGIMKVNEAYKHYV